MDSVHHSSDRIDWGTPRGQVFNALNNEFNFTLDVCANAKNKKVDRYYNRRANGLKQPWDVHGWNWCNPPYGNPEHVCKKNCSKKKCAARGHHVHQYAPGIADWLDKALDECLIRGARSVMLLPARTDTAWFHYTIWDKENHRPKPWAQVRLWAGRITFEGAPSAAPFPSMIVVFDPAFVHPDPKKRAAMIQQILERGV